MGAAILSVGLATWVAYWMSERTNQIANEASTGLFASLMELKLLHMEQIAQHLGALYLISDRPGADYGDREATGTTGLGAQSLDGFSLDLVMFLDASGRVEAGWFSRDDIGADAGPAVTGLAALVSAARAKPGRPTASFLSVGDQTLIASALDLGGSGQMTTALSPHIDSAPGPRPVLVIGRFLTSGRLSVMGERVMARQVRVAPARTDLDSSASSLGLTTADGLPLAVLVWQPPLPGRTALTDAIPTIGGLTAFLVTSTLLVARISARQAQIIIAERHKAQRDALTGLLNRAGLNDLLRTADRTSMPLRGQAAVIYIDLNGFKTLNDTLGHDAGDNALRDFGHRLSQCLRSTDLCARVGGDEFICALVGADAAEAARKAAERIIERSVRPTRIGGQSWDLRPSVGVSVAVPGDSWRRLIQSADQAMYRAKRGGIAHPVVNSATQDGLPARYIPNPALAERF